MKRSTLLIALLAFGMTAGSLNDAQARSPNSERRRVVAAAQIHGWSPQSGDVGTVVSVVGGGFTRNMMVLVGGRKVRPIKMGTRIISFKIPANHGDGHILMRQAGVAQDYNIGRFQVWTKPKISSFSPSSGAPGTRVEIRGSNFKPDDLVMLGAQSLPIESFTASSVTVTIPQAAVDGPFHIQNRRDARTASRGRFKVVAPAPFISSFSPTRGQPGTVVRIRGGNYGNDLHVRYGRSPISIDRSGPNWIEITIPRNAKRDAAISISSRRGSSRSAAKFQLDMPPILSSYAPSSGTVGTRVVINGRNFRADDRVFLGGVECTAIQVRDRQMIVQVPSNAASGSFSLRRGAQEITAASRFDVFYSPTLTSIRPLEGAPGTRVVVRGEQLAKARVFIGNAEVRRIMNTPNQIEFTVPQAAKSGVLRVTGRGGSATYSKPFEVWNLPSIKRLAPDRGSVGSAITISGEMLDSATAFFIGDVEMPILSRLDSNKIVVRVPASAMTGTISWTAHGRNTLSNKIFTVIRATVSAIRPGRARQGQRVQLTGSGLAGARVFFGSTELPVVRSDRRGRKLWVKIPNGVVGSSVLTIDDQGHRSTSAEVLEIEGAPEPPPTVHDHRKKKGPKVKVRRR